MKLEISGSIVSDDADAASIDRGLRGMSGPGDTAILSSDEMAYIQAAGCADQGFALEYQEGSLDRHFAAQGPVKLEAVVAAFLSYARGEDAWESAFSWQKVDL